MSDLNPEWDGETCPFCGSDWIRSMGPVRGEDTGDDGQDYERWRCDSCGEVWLGTTQEGSY